MSDIKYKCNVDENLGEFYDSCVLDYGRADACSHAILLLKNNKTKYDCIYWIPVENSKQVFQWNPMETVPRDGSSFIVYNGESMEILNWPKGYALGKWEKSKSSKKYDGYAVEFPNPIYWTHLPSPPEETE